jgi:carbon monoxide dehydrogenase subunit G
MAGRFEGTVVIERPIEEVFAFLANGENDPKFSPRVLEIAKTTDGPPGVGTVYASTVKDAGMKTKREFRLTEFQPPTRIRWAETSKNLVTAPEGGYDLAPEGTGTRVTIYNVLEGHGPGKLIAPLALRSARKGADDFAKAIKRAVEAS